MSLELGKPFLITDDELNCSLPNGTAEALPSEMTDSKLHPEHFIAPVRTAISSIVQLVSMTGKALQRSFLSTSALERFDEKFSRVKSLIPIAVLLSRESNHHPASARAMFDCLCVQFLIYRHNLQCAPNTSEHTDALVRCLATARHTSECLARMLHVTSLSPEDWEPVKGWRMRLMSVADNTLCLHIWRCTLILCFAGHFQAALICVRTAGAIGNNKKVNKYCGRYLLFFLKRLSDKLGEQSGDRGKIESDEELLAYVEGDLQGISENSWTWADDHSLERSHPLLTEIIDEPMSDDSTHEQDASARPSLTQDDDFDGWESIEILVRRLIQFSKPTSSSNESSERYFGMETNQSSKALKSNTTASSDRRAPDQASRISIANII